jgi:hypothetical protein
MDGPIPAQRPTAAPAQVGDINIAPDTTAAQDMVVAGQRRINLIWEFTQAGVTILITGAAIYCTVNSIKAEVMEFAFVAVVSTYYARTNHTKTGGVGHNESGR